MATTDPKLIPSSDGAPGPVFTALVTAALLAAAAFTIGVQSAGTRAGVVEVFAVLLATAVFGRAAYNGTLPRPFNASLGLLLMAIFAGITALSVSWSILPNASLLDSVRLISYTCVLALAALLAQIHQQRSREILLGIGGAALAIVAYALISRTVPGAFPEGDDFARLRLPFGYWNAVGFVAAFGLVVALWTGTRRNESRVLEIASYPIGGLFVVALMLSQSRGSLLAFAIAVAVWMLLVPQRLRATGWLAAVWAIALLVVYWAFKNSALSTDHVPLTDRKSAGIQLLIALIVLCGLLTGLGALIHRLRHRNPLSGAQRHSLGKALLIALAVFPVLFLFAVGVGTEKGLGTVSDGVTGLFSATAAAPDNSPSRLTQTTSLRGRYWSDSWKIFKSHTWHGTGGDTFIAARLPFRTDQTTAAQAHGMVPQVASDLGILGLLVLLGITAVWLTAAFKLAGAARRAPWAWLGEADEVRLASVTLMVCALLFGLHSAIDWTWFIPGAAYFGLLAGGWTLGSPAAHSVRSTAPAPIAQRGGRPQLLRAAAITLIGISIAYAVYQPVRAERKVDAGMAKVEEDPVTALKLGNDALKLDPTSDDAFILIAVAQSNGGRQHDADATLSTLTNEQPSNPAAWLRLASFRLATLNHPDSAIDALRPLFYLSPNSVEGRALLAQAQQAKANEILEKIAEKKRKALEKSLAQLEELKKQGTPPAVP